jgi:hypothetical protein
MTLDCMSISSRIGFLRSLEVFSNLLLQPRPSMRVVKPAGIALGEFEAGRVGRASLSARRCDTPGLQ